MIEARRGFAITAVGSLYLASVVFAVLRLEGVYSFEGFQWMQDYSAFMVPVLIAAAYLLGLLGEIVISVALKTLPKRLKRLLRGEAVHPSSVQTIWLWHRGSDRLLDNLDDGWSRLMLLRSLCVAVPVLGATAGAWLYGAGFRAEVFGLAIAAMVLLPSLVLTHRVQIERYHRNRAAAMEALGQRATDDLG